MKSLVHPYSRKSLQRFFELERYYRDLYRFPTRIVIDNDGWWANVQAWPKAVCADVALKPIVLN